MISIRIANSKDQAILQSLSAELFKDNAKYDSDLIINWPYLEPGEKYFNEEDVGLEKSI
jgi:hypothetical protein